MELSSHTVVLCRAHDSLARALNLLPKHMLRTSFRPVHHRAAERLGLWRWCWQINQIALVSPYSHDHLYPQVWGGAATQSLPAISRTSTATAKVAPYERRAWGDWSCGVKTLAQGKPGLNRSPEGAHTILGRTVSKPFAFALVSSSVRKKG